MEKQVFSIGAFANELPEFYLSDSSWLGNILSDNYLMYWDVCILLLEYNTCSNEHLNR